MRKLLLLWLVLTPIVMAETKEEEEESDSAVVEINKDNIEDLVLESDATWLVMFYITENCEPCVQMEEPLEIIAEKLENVVRVGRLAGDQNVDLMTKFGIQTVPHFLVFSGDRKHNPYHSNRPYRHFDAVPLNSFDPAGYVKAALAKVPDHVKIVNDDNTHEFFASSDKKDGMDAETFPRVMLFSDKEKVSNLYKALATEFRKRLVFGQVSKDAKSLQEKYGVKTFPTLVVKAPGKDAITYKGETAHDDMAAFLEQHAAEYVIKRGAKAPPPAPRRDRPDANKGAKDAKSTAPPPAPEKKKKEPEPNVILLGEQNFTKFVVDIEQTWLVEFFDGADEAYMTKQWTVYENVARRLKGMQLMGAVNATEFPALAKQYKIDTLPALKIFDVDMKKAPVSYREKRDEASLYDFAEALVPNYVAEVDMSTIDSFLAHEPMKMKVFFITDDKPVPTFYKALSRDFREHFVFSVIPTTEREILKRFNVKSTPTIAVAVPDRMSGKGGYQFVPFQKMYTGPPEGLMDHWRNFFGAAAHQFGGADRESIKKDVISDKAGAGGELGYLATQKDYDKHCGTEKNGLCVIAVLNADDEQAETAKQRLVLRDLAAHMAKDKLPVSIFWVKSHHMTFVEGFRLESGFPAVVVIHPKKERYAVYVGSFSASAMSAFTTQVLRGKIGTIPLKKFPALNAEKTGDLDTYSYKDDEITEEQGATTEFGTAKPKKGKKGGKKGGKGEGKGKKKKKVVKEEDEDDDEDEEDDEESSDGAKARQAILEAMAKKTKQ